MKKTPPCFTDLKKPIKNPVNSKFTGFSDQPHKFAHFMGKGFNIV
jgi:hypothetical protein